MEQTIEGKLASNIKIVRKKFNSFLLNSMPEIKENYFTANDYIIFEFIGNKKKTMNEISEELKLTPGTTTTIIDKLIDKDYVKRERDEKIDRRKVFISLSVKGKKLYTKSLENQKKFSKKILNKLTKQEEKDLFGILKKINEIEFK